MRILSDFLLVRSRVEMMARRNEGRKVTVAPSDTENWRKFTFRELIIHWFLDYHTWPREVNKTPFKERQNPAAIRESKKKFFFRN